MGISEVPCLDANSRDTAVPKRSVNERGRVGGSPSGFSLSEDRRRSFPFAELARDREDRRDPEKKAVKDLEDRGLSEFALEDLFPLSSGCFLVRRRDCLS